MKLPRLWLLPLCIVLTASAYGLMVFTGWGSYYYRGSPLNVVILDGTVVLGAFACWEVFRTESATPVRAVAAAVGTPLALFALLSLVNGVRRYLAA